MHDYVVHNVIFYYWSNARHPENRKCCRPVALNQKQKFGTIVVAVYMIRLHLFRLKLFLSGGLGYFCSEGKPGGEKTAGISGHMLPPWGFLNQRPVRKRALMHTN